MQRTHRNYYKKKSTGMPACRRPVITKKQAAFRLIGKFKRVVRAAEKAVLHKRGADYQAYIKEKYPHGKAMRKPAEYFRVMIHSRELAAYLNRSIRTAQRMMADVRFSLGKSAGACLEVAELCALVTEINEEGLREYLKRVDEEKLRKRKEKQEAKLAKKGLNASEMNSTEIFRFEDAERKKHKKFYDPQRLKRGKEKMRQQYDGYGVDPPKKKKPAPGNDKNTTRHQKKDELAKKTNNNKKAKPGKNGDDAAKEEHA